MTDIFNANAPAAVTDATSTSADVTTASLVGEGKKFKTIEDLAKGKLESDAFIAQLQGELKGMRNNLNRQTDAESKVEELRQEILRLKEQESRLEATKSGDLGTKEPKPAPALSESDLGKLVDQRLTERETERSVAQNIQFVNAEVIKHFGSLEEATKQVRAKAAELGLTVGALQDTAAKSPTAFLKLVIGDKPQPQEQPNVALRTTNINTAALTAATSGGSLKEGTKAYYDDIRNKNVKLYWTPEIQNRIYEAARNGTYEV